MTIQSEAALEAGLIAIIKYSVTTKHLFTVCLITFNYL